MSRTSLTLLWEYWRSAKWRLVLAFCGMLVLPAFLTAGSVPPNARWIDLSHLPPLNWESQMVAIWVNFVICSLAVGYAVGFPMRHYTLPIPTQELVLMRLLPGALTCSALFLCQAFLFNSVLGSGLPYLGPALTYGIGYLLGYSIVSRIYGRENLRTLSALILGMLAGFWIFGHYETWWSFGWRFQWPYVSLYESLFLILTGLTAWRIAESGLIRDRKGLGWAQPRASAEDPISLQHIRQRPAKQFRSPFRALFWLEWRQHGWLWPVALAGTYILVASIQIGVVTVWGRNVDSADPFSEILLFTLSFMAMGSCLPWCMGALASQGKKGQVDKSLPTSISTLPVSDAQLAWLHMARSLCSVLMSWVCLILVGISWAIIRFCVEGMEVPPVILNSTPGQPDRFVATLWIFGWLTFLAWFTTGVGTSTGLSGRTWIVLSPVLIIPIWIGASILVLSLHRSIAELLIFVAISGIVSALAVGALGAYVKAWSRHVIGIKAVLTGLVILCVLEGLWATYCYSQNLNSTALGQQFPMIWQFGLFLALSAAPPAVVPLAVHYNRHR